MDSVVFNRPASTSDMQPNEKQKSVREESGRMNGLSVKDATPGASGYLQRGAQKIADMTCSVLDRGVKLNKLFQPKVAMALTTGAFFQYVPGAAADSAKGMIGAFCNPSWSEFKNTMLSEFGSNVPLIDSNGTDLISALHDEIRPWNRPELIEGVREYLIAGRTVKEGVNSSLPEFNSSQIESVANYACDRVVNGARGSSGTMLQSPTLGEFLEKDARFAIGVSGQITRGNDLPDYLKKALSADCVPQNALTKGCGELTQKDFMEVLGHALGRDTPVFDGEGTATGLTAQLDLLKESNPELAEATLQWLHDPDVLIDGVSAHNDETKVLNTIMEYAQDRYAKDPARPRTLYHLICCETKTDLSLKDYQIAGIRPACLSLTPVSTTEQVVVSAAASATGAFILGGFGLGVAVAGVIAGSIAYYKASHNQTAEGHVRLQSLEASSADPMVDSPT